MRNAKLRRIVALTLMRKLARVRLNVVFRVSAVVITRVYRNTFYVD